MKRWVALGMAAMLLASLVSWQDMKVSAEEVVPEVEEVMPEREEGEETEQKDLLEPDKNEKLPEDDNQELLENSETPDTLIPAEDVSDPKTTGPDVLEDTVSGQSAAPETAGPEEADSVITDDDVLEDFVSEESADQPMVMSLFPYEEQYLSIYLNDYTEQQLRAMPVDDLLDLLVDDQGNKIQIPADAEILCGHKIQRDDDGIFLDEDDTFVDEDAFHKIERGGTVDLSTSWNEDYRMQLIIGEAGQLALGNIRYIVDVYTGGFEFSFEYEVYAQNGSGREKISCKTITADYPEKFGGLDIPVTEVLYYVGDTQAFQAGEECYLNIRSFMAEDSKQGINVKIYPMSAFLEYHQQKAELKGEITDILNQSDMDHTGGHKGAYAEPDAENPLSSDNAFCVVCSDKAGKIIAYQGLVFIVRPGEFTPMKGGIYSYEAGQMKSAAELTYTHPNESMFDDWYVDVEQGRVDGNLGSREWINEYRLLAGYSEDAEYYHVLETNDQIEKIFKPGYNGSIYDTIEEAMLDGAEDVTDQLMPDDRSTAPYGYKIKADSVEEFCVFLKDGSMAIYRIFFSYHHHFFDNGNGLDFEVTGAKGYTGKIYRGASREDSYYKNHYQFLLINDPDADLTKLIPEFRRSGEDVKVYAGSEQKSGESVQDFSNGPVTYSVFTDESPRQYFVTFAKKEAEAKLFVNGPEEREVFLTGVEEYRKHDIVIANVGAKDLTGLKVELQDPSHIKLDSYWTVGGPKNSTLPPFTTVEEKDENGNYVSEGHLFNLAKIRLLPDGNGEISGTLKISADGQEDVYIKLRGYAGNPKIITEGLGEGVKYVPYSYHVATNNMYDWTKVTMSITDGTLPEGVTLNKTTGEIYGVPKEAGEFPITIRASYNREEFESSYKRFTLTIQENTDDYVYEMSDPGYEVLQHVGVHRPASSYGYYHYILTRRSDQLFVSKGEIDEFVGFWLNGEKLIEGEDYTKESGSTRITIRRQTFENKADQSGINTIAAEFRVGGDRNNDLKRTAQNFRIDFRGNGGSGGGSSDGSAENSQGGSAGSGGAGTNPTTLVVHLTDTTGNPLPNLTVELHSTPQITKTNQNGIAVFQNVESGWHTLYVKNGAGNVLASKSFELVFGDGVSNNANQIIVMAGTASTLEIQLNGNELIFQNIQAGDPYQVLPAVTGDTSDPGVWVLLAMLLCVMIFGSILYKKRRSDF